MALKKWYEILFENYSKTYDRETFTQGTRQETDFIENEIGFNKSIEILDVGCGTGRHSVELARRGYSVTGIDLSDDQLSAARAKAGEAGFQIRFIKADARDFTSTGKFGLAIMICEGAFPLMETDEENYRILKNISNVLAPGGKLIFTTLSALYPIFNDLKKFHDDKMTGGWMADHTFDLLTLRDRNRMSIPDDSGILRELDCNERYYMPSEITWMLHSLGFDNVEIYGGNVGNFRKKQVTPDDFELLVIARKP